MTLELGTLSDDGNRYWAGEDWQWLPLWMPEGEVLKAARELFGVEAPAATYLGTGLLNQTWRIGAHIIRVSRGERTLEQITYEHRVLRELNQRLPEVVAPIVGVDGSALQMSDGRYLTAFPFVHGKLGPDVAPEVCVEQSATFMARAHQASLEAELTDQRPGFYAADDRAGWQWPGLREMLMAEVDSAESRRCYALFDEEIATLSAWLDDVSARRSLVRAVVQRDSNPRNLLFDGDRIVGVIDWDDCQVDPFIAAVGKEAYWPGVDTETFWRTYLDAGGPLEEDDFELLAGFARLSAFFELAWAEHGGHAGRFAADRIRDTARSVMRLREAAIIS